MRPSAPILLALAALALGCRPDLGPRESLVTGAEILAVRGDPPEAAPGETVRYSLLVATPAGPVATPLASWAYCRTAKRLTENGAASAACLRDDDGVLVKQLAAGPSTIDAPIPEDACAIFGPEVTTAELRPRDPDVTGGFFQPLRVTVFADEQRVVALGLERIRCRVANAGTEIAREFGERYVANENPELGPLTATVAGVPVPLDAIPRGARVDLHVSWPEQSAERYVVFDLVRRELVERRETMRVSWFTTAGAFEHDRTGRGADEMETFTDNEWTAPADARTAYLFVVLRDARGGTAFATHTVTTR